MRLVEVTVFFVLIQTRLIRSKVSYYPLRDCLPEEEEETTDSPTFSPWGYLTTGVVTITAVANIINNINNNNNNNNNNLNNINSNSLNSNDNQGSNSNTNMNMIVPSGRSAPAPCLSYILCESVCSNPSFFQRFVALQFGKIFGLNFKSVWDITNRSCFEPCSSAYDCKFRS